MKPCYPTLTLDMKKYLGQLQGWDITESQKAEMVEALWGLLVSCAQIGLQIHPVQEITSENPSKTPADMVYSNHATDTDKRRITDA